ncbi:putative glyoxalase superfamily protein PhnB [Lachnospiraceae bacterium PF1-21]|uniref:VOC family protein n=1 Tax=Ohessyouella blattaphilus TaxID=2949333 RepID=A0ABT1EFQ1_9FIRM|nr:VOC family protein [Ohessyouella blattaphilus]MCP1109535.1 VOC family protein [Ohessyouella blattaphilus]MCR8562929.1 VOC family protein [Ohessyouella blattaphilus]
MYKAMTTNLMVKSVDKAMAFYKEVLGFSEVASVPGKNNELQFAILSKDQLMIMMQEKNNFIEEYPVLKTPAVQPSVSLYIVVDNLEALYNELKTKHSIYTELHTSFYGAKEFAITDVDGYVLTFTERN